MTTRFVCNASPLIGFERMGRFDLLQSLTGHLLIPPAVRREVFGARTLPDWVEVRPLSSASSPALLTSRLGDGESEAIALAR
jgi:predicted nucleic acid-binding protein